MGVRNKLMKKKGVKKISMRKKRQDASKLKKAPEPMELRMGSQLMPKKMGGHQGVWDQEDTAVANYKRNGLVADVNAIQGGRGRNQRGAKDIAEAQFVSLELIKDGKLLENYEEDDDLRAANSLPRKSGKAEPKRLTTTQKTIIQSLIAKHGDDVAAMARDIKLNKMQKTQGELAQMLESFSFWGEGGGDASQRHDFRAPKHTGPKRLHRVK